MKMFTGLLVIGSMMSLHGVKAQDNWVQKADFGGTKRGYAVGFSIDGLGYLGGGGIKSFWSYDPVSNVWAQVANFPSYASAAAVAFVINYKGYLGTGLAGLPPYENELWEYDPIDNSWTKKCTWGAAGEYLSVGFSIGDKGYIGTGESTDGHFHKDFWEYDPITNVWTQKSDFGGVNRRGATGFSIGSKGYIGTGVNEDFELQKDFWEYDPNSNIWTQKTDFGGIPRELAVGFSIGNKGYIGTGWVYAKYRNDFWEYDPSTDSWLQKTDFGGIGRCAAVGFSIENKGYIGTGFNSNNNPLKDFWEYTPDTGSCPLPSNLRTQEITSTSAKLRWDSVAGAEKYKVRYKVANTNDWIVLNPVAHHKLLTGLLPNTTYKWQVKTYCKVDSPHIVSEWSSKQEFTTLPLRLSEESLSQLSFQLYPNPAEDHATMQYTLAQSSHISISVFDASGKEIETQLNDDVEQGSHVLSLNLKDFPAGIYFVQLISDGGSETQKLMVQ